MITILSLVFISSTVFAGNYCGVETKTFSAEYSKVGSSFVALNAYYKAIDKAAYEGFRCSRKFRYTVSTSIFDSNFYTAKTEVDCTRVKYNCD